MSFTDLRSFIDHLERRKLLVRVQVPVDPVEEVTVMQHRVLAEAGPALLFEDVKGSPYRMVTNLFGTMERVEAAFGAHPSEIGERVAGLAEELMPPSVSNVWKARGDIFSVMNARMKEVRSGPVMDNIIEPAKLNDLPCLKCWPLDGGHFFTLPLVHTEDPVSGKGNLGIYRLQRYDDSSTGMHWQIEKGGGFHFSRACELGDPLSVSVLLGGPPALTLAAIAPLPEGIDERLLAALIMGSPLDVIRRKGTGHRVAASAEFILEGSVSPCDNRKEGPFGDHLGHYSHSADFPVFRVERMLARSDAIYPATVVGKPPQEDYFIGEALQELTRPLLRIIKPAICDVWAYPETGFHPLAVVSVNERYGHEGLKCAFSVLGEGQLSLTKVIIVVDRDVDVRDFAAVSKAIHENFDPEKDLYLLAPTAQDTLDFTGPALNEGSRMIISAVRKPEGPVRGGEELLLPSPSDLGGDVRNVGSLGRGVLVLQVKKEFNRDALAEKVASDDRASAFPFVVLVSEDVPVDDNMMMLWGWFTRFDPVSDLYPAGKRVDGNVLRFSSPLIIDASWKEGYRKPVAFDPEIEKKVADRWHEYGIGS